MPPVSTNNADQWRVDSSRRIRWEDLYREAELYKAAVRLYTKPLFSWRKALTTSTDKQTMYDFARRGLHNLRIIHKRLSNRTFHFRPGLALHYNFNGKHRTLYVYPWEERLVDLLLYRMLSERFHDWFSPCSYAYRQRGFGVDRCQRRVASALNPAKTGPLYVAKRDVTDYFSSIDHDILLAKLESLIEPDDYLFSLMKARILFRYWNGHSIETASRGIPFGTAIACFFANVYLTQLDRQMFGKEGIFYARYSDDVIAVSSRREALLSAFKQFDAVMDDLRLQSKVSQEKNLVLSKTPVPDMDFKWVDRFKHLGLEFRANGVTGLSRDKLRKICNLFRYSFRRQKGKFKRVKDIDKRAKLAIDTARLTIDRGIRNVAIIDYYLKHVQDERQLRLLDRWLAEQVLFVVFGKGHKKGRFRRLSFKKMRAMGLPSLVHRRRLILHGHIESSFFIWNNQQAFKRSEGTAARLQAGPKDSGPVVFSPIPEAAVVNTL